MKKLRYQLTPLINKFKICYALLGNSPPNLAIKDNSINAQINGYSFHLNVKIWKNYIHRCLYCRY